MVQKIVFENGRSTWAESSNQEVLKELEQRYKSKIALINGEKVDSKIFFAGGSSDYSSRWNWREKSQLSQVEPTDEADINNSKSPKKAKKEPKINYSDLSDEKNTPFFNNGGSVEDELEKEIERVSNDAKKLSQTQKRNIYVTDYAKNKDTGITNSINERITCMDQDDIDYIKEKGWTKYFKVLAVYKNGLKVKFAQGDGVESKYAKKGKLIKRADGHYSQHGLWDSIRENKGSGRKPSKEMLKQEAKIKEQSELSKGIQTEHEHTKTLTDLYKHKIGVNQAIKRTAKDHLKENPKYYSELEKVEKMSNGGKTYSLYDKKGKLLESNLPEQRLIDMANEMSFIGGNAINDVNLAIKHIQEESPYTIKTDKMNNTDSTQFHVEFFDGVHYANEIISMHKMIETYKKLSPGIVEFAENSEPGDVYKLDDFYIKNLGDFTEQFGNGGPIDNFNEEYIMSEVLGNESYNLTIRMCYETESKLFEVEYEIKDNNKRKSGLHKFNSLKQAVKFINDLKKVTFLSEKQKMKTGGIIYPKLSDKPSIITENLFGEDDNDTKELKNGKKSSKGSKPGIEGGKKIIDEVDLVRVGKIVVPSNESMKISNSDDVARILYKVFPKEKLAVQEMYFVLLLSQRNEVIAYYNLSKGGVTGTVADVELVCTVALKELARGVIVAHNHPSGNLDPSKADINLSKQTKEALELLQISLLDSLIIVPGGEVDLKYFSMFENGVI